MALQTLASLDMNFSEEFIDLCNRRRDLGAIYPESREEMLILSDMWESLSVDFDAAAYGVNAEMCHKKALHWKGKANGY